MYGKFIKYYYHKAFTIDEEALFDNPPTKEEIIKVIKSKLDGSKILNQESDEIIFVYRGIRYKTEIIRLKGKYTVDGKEF